MPEKKNEMKITLNALRAKTEAVNLYKYTARYISILIKSNIQCSTCRQQNLPTQINTDTHIYSFIYSNSATFGWMFRPNGFHLLYGLGYNLIKDKICIAFCGYEEINIKKVSSLLLLCKIIL